MCKNENSKLNWNIVWGYLKMGKDINRGVSVLWRDKNVIKYI